MQHVTLNPSQARKIILHAAGLCKPGQFGEGRQAVYNVIQHLGFVQVDTNYVVERAHHHALAARVPGYRLEWLEELQEGGEIFEYLTYATGYMPMHHFKFTLPVKGAFLAKRKALPPPEANLMQNIIDRVTRDGPHRARDFENDRVTASSGWWDWRPSKLALERLYQDGRLMTTRGKDFNKLYDLPKNTIPFDTDTAMPTAAEYARHVIRTSLQALGIAYLKDISWRTRFTANEVKAELQKMVNEGEVCTITVEGLKTQPLYMLASYKNLDIELSGDVFILSPFDILNVLRHRLHNFFNFDYQVECFVPEPKRLYGYFSLPVLLGDTFIARMDAKADRKNNVLIINNLHIEQVKITAPMAAKLIAAIKAFAVFNQCTAITILKSNDAKLLKAIKGVAM